MTTIRIGVVEDEMIIAASIVNTLKKLNYSVAKPASNYNEAVKMIVEERPQLLLLDINLGGQKDGIDVATYVRAQHHLPIIFLTANSDIATVQRAKTLKPNAYLLKPFTKDDLYSAIEIAFSNYDDNYDHFVQKGNIILKSGHDYINLKFSEIIFMESNDNYVSIHMDSGKPVIIRSTLSEVANKFPSGTFTRINRSIIINHAFIQKIENDQIIVAELIFAINPKSKQQLLDKLWK